MVNPELQFDESRNQLIDSIIAKGMKPILPFESELLIQKFEKHKLEQSNLGRELGKAMSESSETWHDNAPAEAISSLAHILVNQANATIKSLRDAKELSYPELNESEVTLGSIVSLHYTQSDKFVNYLLTGIVLENNPDNLELSENTELITIQSPLGLGLIGKKLGDIIELEVGPRKFEILISEIIQFNPDIL